MHKLLILVASIGLILSGPVTFRSAIDRLQSHFFAKVVDSIQPPTTPDTTITSGLPQENPNTGIASLRPGATCRLFGVTRIDGAGATQETLAHRHGGYLSKPGTATMVADDCVPVPAEWGLLMQILPRAGG